MKIAILGGTGSFGKGMSARLALKHDVILGSRSADKAEKTASLYLASAQKAFREIDGSIVGMENAKAVKSAELVILAVNAGVLESFLDDSRGFDWEGKLVLSPATRFERVRGVFLYMPFKVGDATLSAAELVQNVLGPTVRVVSGMQLVPATKLADLNSTLLYDVPFAGPKDGFLVVSRALSCIAGLRYLYAGPLSISYSIEAVLPLMLNMAVRNSLGEPGLRLV